ncbi:T6SS effector amidase Tae4 family protein [Cupriavidus sp. YAF13]|uniref:T6SS effector amidase Tae4 family protein n=1 Tax=Cupriavidus sp. YAF13 TaxID=3233075 RepID=UPI003F8E90FA
MALSLRFDDLWHAYPKPGFGDDAAQRRSRLALFRQIGWESRVDDPACENACAIRMSLALIECGVHVDGNDPILVGRYKGMKIETSRARLAEQLSGPAYLGAPRQMDIPNLEGLVTWTEQGIISFDETPGCDGGHIDLLRNAWLASAFESHDLNPVLEASTRGMTWRGNKLGYEDMGYADMADADSSCGFRSTLYFWPLA